MTTFVVFIISLVLIILLFTMKGLEIYHGRKIILEELFLKCDAWIHKTSLKIKYWWSHVNFKNMRLIFSWIIVNIRKLVVSIKRRFDHKQSHFFIKREYDVSKKNNSVSFFLKDVSDYKKSLREEGRAGENK
jgi:hypothetical protein